MSILNRLWTRESPEPDSDPALAQRLKEMTGKDGGAAREGEPAESAKAAARGEQAAAGAASQTADPLEAPPQLAAASAAENSRGQNGESGKRKSPPAARVAGIDRVVAARAPESAAGTEETRMEEQIPKMPESKDKPEGSAQMRAAAPPAPRGPGQQFMERFNAAVGRADGSGEKSSPAGREVPPEFQNIQKQFEADFRKRLDGALAEFERRVSSQALVEDISAHIEQRIRKVADGIFKEVKDQAWMMHSAVAGELRAFRDQFGKEMEERVVSLDRAAQHALQLKQSLEEVLPKAEGTLHSLASAGQAISAQSDEASKLLEEQLRNSREEFSREIESQKTALHTLAQGLRDDGLRLQEQMEKLRGESAAACELIGCAADQSLEKLNAAADEVNARAREGIERLAAEIERRILEGGLMEKATERFASAAEEIARPSLDHLRQAGQGADSAAEVLGHAAHRVTEQLAAARKQIEGQLDGLLGVQLNLLEDAMSGFHRKASEELGNLVERVVSQSTSQLDEKLHGMLQELFTSTTKQINNVARASLSNVHEGLKEALVADSADAPAEAAQLPAAD